MGKWGLIYIFGRSSAREIIILIYAFNVQSHRILALYRTNNLISSEIQSQRVLFGRQIRQSQRDRVLVLGQYFFEYDSGGIWTE